MIVTSSLQVAAVLRRVFSEYALGVDVSMRGSSVVWLNCPLLGVQVRVVFEDPGFCITVYDSEGPGLLGQDAPTVEDGIELLRAVIEDALCGWGRMEEKHELRKMRRDYA